MNKDYRSHLLENFGERIVRSTREFVADDYKRYARRFQKVYGSFLPANRAARILDIGCGDGQFLYFLKEAGYSQIEGIDTSDDRLELCRRYVTPSVHCSEGQAWFRDHPEAYDVIVCNHLVEHLPGDTLYEFMELMTKSLKPGGRLIITTPNANSPWAGWNLYNDLTHCRLFTVDSLTQLLSLFGLTSQMHPDGAVPIDVGSTLRWLAWKIFEPWIKFRFRIEIGGTRGHQKTPLIVSMNLIAVADKPQAPDKA